MQTNFNIYTRFVLNALLFCAISTGLLFTSCEKDDDEKTSSKIELLSYGPMPIARGAELRFIGNNLDKVTAIILPDAIEIPASAFTSKKSTLITLTVPQEAIEGYVVLKTPQGDITTKTPIGYSEPISITSFAPTSIKPGAQLTITGDYLNLVDEVIFTDRVVVIVEDFVSQSRTEIKLVVPAQAQTGKIAVSNGEEDPIIVYSENVLNVTLPAFSTIAPNPVKAGQTLTISGTNLDLTTKVILGGNKVISTFGTHTATQIVLTVPADTKDGKVIMVPASDVEVESTADLIMVVPTLTVTPTTVKNGGQITVSGTNLDLISSVTFGGNKAGTIVAGGSATEITVNIPIDALDGVVSFKTLADKTVEGPVLTFVKPGITSFAPISGKPNTNTTITGTDLDLVADVIFTGGIKGTIVTKTETQIVVTVPVGALTGIITLKTVNATVVASANSFEVLTNLPNISGFTETRGEPGKILTINGTNLSLIKQLVFPNDIYATAFGIKTDTKVEVYVPLNVKLGDGQIKMITYEGEIGLLPYIFFGSIDPIFNESLCFFNFNGTGKDSWWGGAMGSGIETNVATAADGTPYWRVNGMSGTGNWDGLFFRNGGNNFSTTGVQAATWAVRFDIKTFEPFPSTGNLSIRLGNFFYDFNLNTLGYSETTGWITVTAPLTGFLNSGVPLSDPSVGAAEFGMVWRSGTSVKVNIGIDNVRFEPIP